MSLNNAAPFKLAIIGGGPNCVYALDRLASLLYGRRDLGQLQIHVYDAGGLFGCGEVHNAQQSETSLLNRIAGQIGFGCDEKTPNTNFILPKQHRFNFMEWVHSKYQETGEECYRIAGDDWPPRYIHGEGLQAAFTNYAEILEADGRVIVILHNSEVVDIRQNSENFDVIADNEGDTILGVNELLLATGIQSQQKAKVLKKSGLDHLDCPDEVLVTSMYPMANSFTESHIGPDSSLCIRGTGVSAMDLMLYLTEGRGGIFEYLPNEEEFKYHPSGREPKNIIMVGRSGLFCGARPENRKSSLRGEVKTEGAYFNRSSIDELRTTYGTANSLFLVGPRKQLNFERHVLPLMVLEMAVLYYSRLLGDETFENFQRTGAEIADRFIGGHIEFGQAEDCLEQMLRPLHDIFVPLILERLESFTGLPKGRPDVSEIWNIYVLKYLEESNNRSIAGREREVCDSLKFDWEYISNPFSRLSVADGREYLQATLKLMDRDLWEARRGNCDSPLKFACDTVWRDYRPVLTDCVDSGGLTPVSQKLFLDKYLSIHNRIADGPSLAVVGKLRALIAQAIVDVDLGFGAEIRYDTQTGRFHAVGNLADHAKEFDVFCLGYLQTFDVGSDSRPLYGNLLKQGLILPWNNDADVKIADHSGGIAINENLNPVNHDGRVIENMTFIGPPIEGIRFFHHTLCRSDTLQPTIKNLVNWGNRLETRMDAHFEAAKEVISA